MSRYYRRRDISRSPVWAWVGVLFALIVSVKFWFVTLPLAVVAAAIYIPVLIIRVRRSGRASPPSGRSR
jgi:hypothetical protein